MAISWDTRRFDAALTATLAKSKREFGVVLREQARGVVRRVIQMTPPKTKGAGTATIKADFKKIFRMAPRSQAVFEHPKEIHARYRSKTTGRINPRSRKQLIPVLREELIPFRNEQLSHVGFLKSGWAMAAERLGLKMPAFAQLPAPGDVVMELGGDLLRIEFANLVKYAGAVRGLSRAMQAALTSQAGAMERRLASALRESALAAGFR